MPTYEYTCRDCGHTFEIVQSMWDEALTMCPECGGSLRKVFAPPAISFKGSGFYATDHGKKAKKPSETAAKEFGAERPGGEKKAGAKGDGEKPTKKEPKDTSSASGASTRSSQPTAGKESAAS